MPDRLSADHLALDDLADLAVGELSSETTTAAETHLAACPGCRAELAQLRADLSAVGAELGALGATPLPAMPVTVAARLDRALASEASAGQAGDPAAATQTHPGSDTTRPGTVTPLRAAPLKAPTTATYAKQTGLLRIMLAAAVAAAVVGFGGYVVSASAGLNEPSSLSPTQVNPAALASQATELAQRRNLDPHLFSAAWRCARSITGGRITGIAPVYVDGEQAYLVYTRASGTTYATLVTGCDGGSPLAGDRVALTQ